MTLGNERDQVLWYVSRIARSIEGSGSFDQVVLCAFLDLPVHGYRHPQIYRGYSCRGLVGDFEHYTAFHPRESTLKRFEAANECLCSYDLLSGMMRSEHEYGLLTYMACYIAPIYTHLAAGGNPKVE